MAEFRRFLRLRAKSEARLGWTVTATDVTVAYLEIAESRARREGLSMDSRTVDMRELRRRFRDEFDWVVTCMALDNLLEDDEIQQAVAGMFAVLKPGGKCYVRLRNLDNLMAVKPRYELKEDVLIPHGRVIRLEDWEYENDTHVVNVYAFLRQDDRKAGHNWQTDVFGYRRRALRKAELQQFLVAAGFQGIRVLPQPSPWCPFEMVAEKAEAGRKS